MPTGKVKGGCEKQSEFCMNLVGNVTGAISWLVYMCWA